MKLDFHYTFDDLAEAYAAHTPKPPERRASTARTIATALLGVGALLVFMLLIFSLAILPSLERSSPPGRPALLDIAMPVIALSVLFTPWLAYRSLKVHGARGIWRSRSLIAALAWLVVAGLLVILWRLASRMPSPDGGEPVGNGDGLPWRSIGDILLPHVAWLLLVAALFFLMIRQDRQQLLAIWRGSAMLHRPHTLTVHEDGLTLAEPLARLEAKWFAFDRVIETRNLFLLYVTDHSFHMVPKRAFADAAQVDEFRAAIDNNVTHRPAAFPVLPVGG